jgi:hypothetical protein
MFWTMTTLRKFDIKFNPLLVAKYSANQKQKLYIPTLFYFNESRQTKTFDDDLTRCYLQSGILIDPVVTEEMIKIQNVNNNKDGRTTNATR